MNTFLRYHAAMLTWHTGSIDEIFHFIVGDNHRRVKTSFFYNRFCLVSVVFYIGCCASWLLYKFKRLLISHIRKNKVGKKRLLNKLLLPIYFFFDHSHRDICLDAFFLYFHTCQGCASICGTKNVPNLLTTWHTIQGHPCMGVLSLMTLNFGGGAGGKSSTRGIFTASSGVSIRQCWRMLLRFFVHNLRISPFTNINALTECLVPQLVYCLCQLVNYIWFPLV